MSWIYLHPCMSSNACSYLDESKSMRLQPTRILSKSLHHQVSTQWWLKTRKHETLQTYPWTISIYQISIGIKFHDCHFGYTSALPCKTNPCRNMNSNSKWSSQLLMSYINLQQPTQVKLHDHDQHHHPRYVIPY